jgi:bifunctional enzyme CysN/CysC
VAASVTAIKYKVDTETLVHAAGKTLGQNEIGVCNLSLQEPIAFDPYAANRTTGSFILIDRYSNATVAAGMIQFALRRATNIHIQKLDIDRWARARLKHQTPVCIWLTGLSGAGKSTIANLIEHRLHDLGRHTYILDGDNVRHGLNRNLGFDVSDRIENMRRVAEVAKLMLDAGLIVLVSLISPFRAEREMVRQLFAPGEFIEVHVDAPLGVCAKRDPKGLYRKAAEGKIKNFTGIDSAYEPPLAPDLLLQTDRHSAEELAERVVERLRRMGAI